LRPVSRVPRDSEQRLLAPPTVVVHRGIARKNAAAMASRIAVVIVALAVSAFLIYDYAVGPRDGPNRSTASPDDP
jgi:hypothetical protein